MRYQGWCWILLTSLLGAADDGWTRFRGPNGSGVVESADPPVEFGPGKNQVWKTAVPFGRSSPIIAGDRIFITASEDRKLVTMCLDRATGRVLWRREIVPPRKSAIYKTNDPASPSPVTDGKNVYAFFADLGLVSYGPDGNERWRLPLGPFDTFYGIGSSPVLAGDSLLMICDTRSKAFMVSVDKDTGRERWRIDRATSKLEGYTSPVIYEPAGEAAQVIVQGANRVEAYALSDGARIWWLTGLGSFPVSSPVLAKGVAIVTSYGADGPSGPTWEEWTTKNDSNKDGRLAKDELKDFDEFGGLDLNADGFIDRAEYDVLSKAMIGDHGLFAVRLGGRGDVTKTNAAWKYKKSYPTLPTSIVYRDVFYSVKSGGIIMSMDPATGEVFKTDRSKDALDEYYSSPVAAGGRIYFINEHGKVTVLKAGKQWEILAVHDLGEETHATPAIAGGQIFVRTKTALYCFGKK